MKKALALLLIVPLFAACGSSTADAPEKDKTPNIEVGGENGVYEFQLSDGTRCVLADGYEAVALDCEWQRVVP